MENLQAVYEEFAIALDGTYGDEFEDIISDVELVKTAMRYAKKECPDVSEEAIKQIGREVLKLYK